MTELIPHLPSLMNLAYRTNINVGTDGKFQIELPEGRCRLVLALGAGYYLKTLES